MDTLTLFGGFLPLAAFLLLRARIFIVLFKPVNFSAEVATWLRLAVSDLCLVILPI